MTLPLSCQWDRPRNDWGSFGLKFGKRLNALRKGPEEAHQEWLRAQHRVALVSYSKQIALTIEKIITGQQGVEPPLRTPLSTLGARPPTSRRTPQIRWGLPHTPQALRLYGH